MSQHALFTLPMLFTYRQLAAYGRWEVQEDGRVIGKGLLDVDRIVDAWDLRKQFLETESTPEAVQDFLNRALWWGHPLRTTFEDFCNLQIVVRKALLVPLHQYAEVMAELGVDRSSFLLTGFSVRVDWSGRKPVGRIIPRGSLEAILTTVEIDRLRNVQFGVCVRPDCREIYEIRSKHKRKYCSQSCAHVENVRRLRKQSSRKRKLDAV